jgi:ferredoxin
MKRQIIRIDEELCNGCGSCIPGCPEGALQIIEGKARLVSDLFCDGLGACLGECPTGAITVEEREAEPYDERRVMAESVIPKGEAVIRAHLHHLQGHGEEGHLREALAVLEERGLELPPGEEPEAGCLHAGHGQAGCPGAQARETAEAAAPGGSAGGPELPSQLRQWPVQMHLIPPSAPYFRDADVLLAADCTAYAHGDFHREFIRGRRLAIACPKLDSQQEIYLDKLKALIDFSEIRSLTVLTMEVPCCRGLLALARRAAAEAQRRVPLYWQELSVEGRILQEAKLR